MKAGLVTKILWFLFFLVLWELIRLGSDFSPLIYPSLKDIFASLFSSVKKGVITQQLFFSLAVIFLSLIFGTLLAFILVLGSHISPILDSLLKSLVSFFHPLPGIAVLPVIILWTGTGIESVLIIVIHSVLWPMVTNLYTGYSSIPENYTLFAKNYRMGSLSSFLRITLPHSLPYIFAGLKISFARSWRALISAEMIFGAAGGKGGIGWYIFNKRVFMDTAGIYAGLIIIILTGIIIEELFFNFIEKHTVKKWGMVN